MRLKSLMDNKGVRESSLLKVNTQGILPAAFVWAATLPRVSGLLVYYIRFWIHQASTIIVLVLQPCVRPEPLRSESRVQDTGPPETSWPHVISNGKSSLRDLHVNAKTQLHSTTSKLQCWTPYAKQLARQEHSPIH